ncbi:MAG: MarR family transcriptional regulator [Bradyrhizobium sp.]|nr:MarR family transcriptional regulator [Bradyrhizobium sp.]
MTAERLDSAREEFSRSIGFLLQRAHHTFRAEVVAALAGSGLNPGQLAIVAALASVNDLSQRELTRLTDIEKSSMVLFLNQLEADGWVERRTHPTDGRAHAIHLSEAGRARLGPIGQRLVAAEATFLEGLSDAEKRQLAELLHRLGHH